jgi:hypothetical protein
MGDTVRWMEASWSFSHKGRFLLLSRYLKLSAYALRAKPTYNWLGALKSVQGKAHRRSFVGRLSAA